MPSPFPGMDPYLEDPIYWGGVHTKLYVAILDSLNRTMPAGYFADIDEHVWLQTEEPDDRRLLGKPDVFVADRNGGATPAGGGVAVAAPLPATRVTLPKGKKRTQRYLKIVAPDHSTVVTVVEILSPSNKGGGSDRAAYLAKRTEYFAARTNVVEIDLLRGGDRMPVGHPAPPAGDYALFVCRGDEYPAADVWSFTVRDPIPPLPVPLKPKHGTVTVDLQAAVTGIYDSQRYAGRVDYTRPLTPALRRLDAEWAAELLKKHTRKKK